MAESKTPVSGSHEFALRSGERAILHFWSDHYTSVRLESKTFPKDANLVAVVSLQVPHGAATNPEYILGQIAETASQLNDKAGSFWSDFRALAEKSLEREIGILDIKAQAKDRLAEYAQTAALETDVMASREKQDWLKQVTEDLAATIDRSETFPNRQFRGLGEATARCLLLYRDDPDAYAALTGRICSEETDVFLDSLRGLATLNHLVRGLSDDHNFVFNPATKAVEYESAANAGARGLVPETFLDIVKAVQASSAAKSLPPALAVAGP